MTLLETDTLTGSKRQVNLTGMVFNRSWVSLLQSVALIAACAALLPGQTPQTPQTGVVPPCRKPVSKG